MINESVGRGASALAPEKSSAFTEELRARLGNDVYQKYVDGAAVFRTHDNGVDVLTPSGFTAEWLNRRFGDAIRETAQSSDRSPLHVQFVPSPESFGAANRTAAAPGDTRRTPPLSAPVPTGKRPPRHRPRVSNRLTRQSDLRHRLDTFCVGDSNRLAHASALRLLESTSAGELSPLCIHGGCGVGKTHLLQGVAARALEMQPGLRVLYTSAEQFTNGFITSIREKSVDEFRRRHRDLSILCIDDAHFLANKSATQREFLHTFDTLGLENARLVLASDSHPNEVRALSKELRSRFVSGLVVRIDAPDSTLRRSLVERIAAARSIAITPDAVEAIASRPSESVREIEGMLTTLDAHLRVSGAMHVDAAAVRMYFSVKKRCTPHRPVRLNEITRVVSGTLCVEGAEVLGASRHKRSVLARSVAATLARRLTTASFPEIGRALGRRGHSGVIAAVKRIETAAAVDAPCDAGPAIGVIGTEALLARLAEEIVSTQ